MVIIIPARYDSSRLPGKPLADIAGKPLIQRVYDCALQTGADMVVVATDDERIKKVVEEFGGRTCITSSSHQSGTDRIAEAIAILGLGEEEVIINLQGDEPMMPPGLVKQVARMLESNNDAVMATACHAFDDMETMTNPNVVKVVLDKNHRALYFSRAPIPWHRDIMGGTGRAVAALRHIGLYAYRAGFVSRYASWPVCPLEEVERLEQLRVLWHGEKIMVCQSDSLPEAGVDTPEDLERVRRFFQRQAG